MITGHGGNVQALAARHRCSIDDITDMSSNINPLGPPEGFEHFLKENIHRIRSLPPPDAGEMVRAFSRFYGVQESRVLGGNGTTWFIYTLPQALEWQNVVIAGPTYSDYRDGCRMHGAQCRVYAARREEQFQPDLAGLDRVSQDADAVILCNPNNPTGALLLKQALLDFAAARPDTWVVVDESYLPFVPGAEQISLVSETGLDNLIVLSSMSKIFRIPGLRTGFVTASPKTINALMRVYQPWSVNALAQAAIVHIMESPDRIAGFMEKTRTFVVDERRRFEAAVADIPSIELFPSQTYFILARLRGEMNSAAVCQQMGDARILIRDCENFKGLSDRFVRFSLKDGAANDRLARLLRERVV